MTDSNDHKPVLKLYNSLTRKKEDFIPQDPKRVTMYNCGPTVYSYAHIGNARAAVVADVLFRVLRHIYGEDHVVYARNITDVDDKIIAAAKEQGVPMSEITEKYARIYNEDLAAIGCLAPTYQPKATDAIEEMQDIIVELLEKDIAYISGNDILFDVSKDKGYGRLVEKSRFAGDEAGVRIAVTGNKRNSADFMLWKYVEGEGEEFAYPAPKIQAFADNNWRKFFNEHKMLTPGRPGWHIECSAMIRDVLGETIDVHCGGVDLKFPHHENEIAQSECANGKPLANFWVHNEFLNMGSEKMSKSIGNVKLINDLLKDWDGEVIRLALLKAHYRSELIWSEKLLADSKKNLDSLYRAYQQVKTIGIEYNPEEGLLNQGLDDLDLTIALHNLVAYSYRTRELMSYDSELDSVHSAFQTAASSANLLGLLQKDPEEWFKGGVDTAKFDQLVQDYDAARADALAAKEAGDKALMGPLFAKTDAIRDELKAEGIVIESGPDGSSWRKA